MKTIKKSKSYEMFVCEICKRQSSWKSEIEKCEKSHGCKHDNVHYTFIEAGDVWWFSVKGVVKKCVFCKSIVDKVFFEGLEDDQEFLKEIFEIANKHITH